MSADKQTLEVYAAQVAEYEARSGATPEYQPLVDFLDVVPPGARVLDFGCGPGQHAAIMQDHGLEVVAWDASPAFVEAAREKGVDAHLHVFDDLDDVAAYDAIWASFSLLHAPRAAFPRHLAAMTRALCRPGHLYLGLKLGDGEKRDTLGRFYTYFSEAELNEALEREGYAIVKSTTGEAEGLDGAVSPYIHLLAHHA